VCPGLGYGPELPLVMPSAEKKPAEGAPKKEQPKKTLREARLRVDRARANLIFDARNNVVAVRPEALAAEN
jgi:hypothetical protein